MASCSLLFLDSWKVYVSLDRQQACYTDALRSRERWVGSTSLESSCICFNCFSAEVVEHDSNCAASFVSIHGTLISIGSTRSLPKTKIAFLEREFNALLSRGSFRYSATSEIPSVQHVRIFSIPYIVLFFLFGSLLTLVRCDCKLTWFVAMPCN